MHLDIARVLARQLVAEGTVRPDACACRVDKVHLAGAEQVMLGAGDPLQEVPGRVLVGRERRHRHRPDPDVGRRCLRGGVGREGRKGQVAGFGIARAVHEVAKDVRVEHHRRFACGHVGADLIPRVGRPVGRARILDHLHPLGVVFLRHVGVHRGRQLAVRVHVQVHLLEAGIARQEARVDRRPGPRAAHTDAVATVHHRLGGLGGVQKLVDVGRNLQPVRIEDALVVGDVVLLVGQRDAPLLGIIRPQSAAGLAVPGTGLDHARQEVIEGIARVGLGRVLDVFVQVVDPAGRAIGPGHVGARHEGVVFRRPRRQRRRHLVEVDVLGEYVIGDLDPGHRLEILKVGDHRIGIGVLVQKKLDARALVLHPVEVLGQRPGRRAVQHDAGHRGRQAQPAQSLDHAAAAHLTPDIGVDKVLFLVIHAVHSSLWPCRRSVRQAGCKRICRALIGDEPP